MKCFLLWSIFWLFFNTADAQRTTLYMGYITTITGSFQASGGRPAVDMALELINERDDILQNYTLTYTDVLDSGCNHTKGLDVLIELMNRDITYISLLGCGCSTSTISVAEISHYWNMPQLAYAAGANVLNDKTRFKYFFRTLVSFRYVSQSLGQLMREFGWRQMSVITQDEPLFSRVTDELASIIFKDEGWILDRYDVPSGHNPLPFFDRSETQRFRIIHINSYPDIAYPVLCEAYYRGMFGSKYLWILPLWYNAGWWRSNSPSSSNNESCTDEIMMQVIDGSLGIVPDGYLTLQNKSIVTFSGLTSGEYLSNYTDLLTDEPMYENLTALAISGVAFDGVWAIAVALDIASKKILSRNESGCENVPGDLVPLERFNYTNMKLGCILRQSFSEVNFLGVTGQIKFNRYSSRNDNVILYQQYRVINGEVGRYFIGYVTFETPWKEGFFEFATGESMGTLWSDGVLPYDGFPVIGITTNSIALVVIYDIVAGIGIIFAIVCFIFNIIFRKKRIVKLTSPNLNHIIILGSVLLYISVIFYSISSINKTIQSTFCNIRVWLFSLGYNLCFGVILSKTWRIYYIFNNPKPKKKGVKDWVLLFIILLIIAIDIIIILVGSTVPQSRLTSFEVVDSGNPQEINEDEKFQNNFILVCNTRVGALIWLGISFGYKGILQVLAIFMAFHTRHVKIKILNESKETAAFIYINSIILVLLIVTEFTLSIYHNTYAALFGLGLLIEASLFLGLIFIPKMVYLYLDPKGEKIFAQSGAKSGSHVNAIANDNTIDNSSEETITNLQKRVKELKQKLKELS